MREALIALEVEGLVEVRIGSGIYVLSAECARRRTRRHAADRRAHDGATAGPFELLRARYVIEGECAALAAKSAKKAQVQAIEDALDADAARTRRAADSRWRAIGCSTCASPRPRATARWSRWSSMLWEERTGPLYKQLEHHYDSPGAVAAPRWPSIAPC